MPREKVGLDEGEGLAPLSNKRLSGWDRVTWEDGHEVGLRVTVDFSILGWKEVSLGNRECR